MLSEELVDMLSEEFFDLWLSKRIAMILNSPFSSAWRRPQFKRMAQFSWCQ